MTPNPEAAAFCLAVSVTAAASIPVLLTADPTVTTYRPAWADHLTLRPVLITWAALLLLLGGPVHDDDYDDEREPLTPAEQAAGEDGFTSLAAFLAVSPFPQQQDRRHAA